MDGEEEDDCVLFGSDSDSGDEFHRKEVFCWSAPSKPGRGGVSLFPRLTMPESQVSLSVDDLCCLVSSGDIVLFNGCGTSSWMVRLFTPATVSHAAIVHMLLNNATGQVEPCLIESVRHTDNIADIHGEYVAGVRVVPMRERIATYHGYSISVRFLQCCNKDGMLKRTREYMTEHLNTFMTKYQGRGYNQDWRDFLNARLPIFRNTLWGSRFDKRDKDRQFFCSELLGQCFIEAGMLDGMVASASAYSPDSFSTAGALRFSTPSALVGANLEYSPELYISMEKDKKDNKK